ncbi:VWA domain-containing protein [Nocardia cyriacigeorgica]|uniref:VWA domain-containing protein n=1 Tax=Nocardia cyriacigeorgica TaxID=135487 RepID=UPI002458B9A4|nr:VWA domain-containing protein [Nocardia cyriacigeorgica]
MEATVHWFIRLLRSWDVRISVAEAADAMRCAAQPGVLTDRETLRCALRASLIKDERDDHVFTELFDAFFALVRIGPVARDRPRAQAPAEAPVDEVATPISGNETFTLSGQPAEAAQSEGAAPQDVRHMFDTDELAPRFNLSQDEGMIDLSAPTEEISFSQGNQVAGGESYRLQLDARRLGSGAAPGQLTGDTGAGVDLRLGLDEQEALLDWLGAPPDSADPTETQRVRPLGDLPEALRRHAEGLLALYRRSGRAEHRVAGMTAPTSSEQARLEESLRRIARSLRGAPTHRRRIAAGGTIDAARTMRSSMRFDGVPFAPVTVRRADSRPRLLVLADVSLSVRATSHFTLNLMHSLQDLFSRVQTYAFVADVVETTALFTEHRAERAVGELLGGDVIDLEANSDYGAVFRRFRADHANALTRRTTLLVLGDGRGNGNDPALAEFAELTRRARETVWLTPEPRYSWRLGSCDLPAYAEHCDQVHVVRGLRELAHTADALATGEFR